MANFTPQQIEQFLQEFFDVVGTRQYVGARYVPLFGRRGETSTDWDNTAPYEPLTIVTYGGDSYTSRQYVPAGVEISNTDYWAKTGNFNAQIEQYRTEVLNLAAAFDQLQDDVQGMVDAANAELQQDYEETKANLEQDVDEAIDAINDSVVDIREEVFGTKYMVVIGDSFSNNAQSGSPLWYTFVARQYDLTPYCNARDGRGFGAYLGHTDYTFVQQAQQAVNELDPDTVKRVYVVGGLNDTRHSSFNLAEFNTGVRNVLNILTQGFPNATLEMYGPQSFPQLNRNTRDAAIYMAWACANYGVEYHDLSAKFNAYPEFFGGNGGTSVQNTMHPSAKGEAALAQAILAHGVLPQPAYNPNAMPQFSTPPILRQVWYQDGGEWSQVADNQITGEYLETPDGITFDYRIGITSTTIPSTATRLCVIVPFGYSWLTSSAASYAGVYGEMSQLFDNIVHTGWLDRSDAIISQFGVPVIMFNINGNYTLKTGAGQQSLRFRLMFSQRG